MNPPIRGNGIPSWPEALRQAALPPPFATSHPARTTVPAPARIWRASHLENRDHGTGSAPLPAGHVSENFAVA